MSPRKVCVFSKHFKNSFLNLQPGRLTWKLQINHLERKMIFPTSMIMFHVNLQGCTSKPKKWLDFVHQPYHLSPVCCAQTTICGNACAKVLDGSCDFLLSKKITPTDDQWGKGCLTKLCTHLYINKVNIGGCNCCNPLTNIPIPDIVKETVVNADNSPRPAGEFIIAWKGKATNRRKTLQTTG